MFSKMSNEFKKEIMREVTEYCQVLQHDLSHHLPAVCQCDVWQADAELHLRSALEGQTGGKNRDLYQKIENVSIY